MLIMNVMDENLAQLSQTAPSPVATQQPANINRVPLRVVPNSAPAEAFDVSWMLRDNRIHIEDGSQFLPFNYLMLHPKELAPENQQRTYAKLVKHLAIPAPSFFGSYPRNAVAFSLASVLPVSQAAQMQSLKEQMDKLEQQAKDGIHPDGHTLMDRYLKPFSADAKSRTEAPPVDAASQEFMTSALTLYMVLHEALFARAYPKEPAAYAQNLRNPDGVMSDIASKLGMSLSEYVVLAQSKGVDGVAEKLGIAAPLLEEIKGVAAEAAKHHYSENVVMNWEAGRHAQGMANQGMHEKIAVGLLQRAGSMMQQLLQRISPTSPMPEAVKESEQRVLAMLRELPKPLQEAIYYSGLEMGFVSGQNLAAVRPHLAGAGGMNMFIPFDVGSSDGLRQIINSNFENRGYSRKVLHHEVNHLFFPKLLGEEGIAKLEGLILADAKRLGELRDALDGWYKAAPADKPRLEAEIDTRFKVNHLGLHEALSSNSGNPISMQRLLDVVDDALKNLNPDSKELTLGYPTPELRAAEIISRFSERQYATLADQPALVGFISPNLMVGYHDIYLKHIEKQVEQFKAEQQALPPQLRYMGLPPDAAGLPQTQSAAMQLAAAAPKQNAAMETLQAPSPRIEGSSILAHLPAGVSTYLSQIEQSRGMPDDAMSGLTR